MLRKLILYNNKMWKPSKYSDVVLMNYINKNLLNLKISKNRFNKRDFGYRKSKELVFEYFPNSETLHYNKVFLSKLINSYSKDEIDKLFVYIFKFYYDKNVNEIKSANLGNYFDYVSVW